MKASPLIAALCVVAFSGGTALAQTDASPTPRPTPPPGPLLNKAPDFAAWTVVDQRVPADSRPAESKPGSAKSPETVTTITKTNQTRHYVIRHRIKRVRDGSQQEVWQQGPYLVTHESMWQGSQLGFETVPDDTPVADFPEFGWISADNFVGVQMIEGTKCLVFDAMVVTGHTRSDSARAAGDGKESKGDVIQVHEHACIDLETRLPKILVSGDTVARYTFQPPPGEMLVLPPADQEMINGYLRDNAARLRPPQHP